MESTPVSRASLETKCGGIRLQSCRRTLSLDAVGLAFFFITSSKELTRDQGAWDELVANNSGLFL
jgi:hypothetical protein